MLLDMQLVFTKLMEFKLSISNPFKVQRKGSYHVLPDKWSKRVLADIYDFLHFRQRDYGNTAKYIKSYERNGLVYIVVNKLATNSAHLPRKVVDKNGKEISNSKIMEVLEKPNDYQSKTEFYQLIDEYLATTGNAFIKKLDGIGLGTELEVLNPTYVRILINSIGEVVGYEYVDNVGKKHKYTTDEVLHIRLSNKLTTERENKYWGLSPLSSLWNVVESSNDLFTARASIWKNKGIIGVLTNKSDLPMLPKERKDMQDKFDKDTGGADKANGMYVTAANVGFVQTSMSPADLKLLEGNIDNLRTLSSGYKLPSVLFNDVENSTYNNVLESKKDAYTDAYIPLANKVDEKLSKWLSDALGVEEIIVVDVTKIEVLKLTTNEVANSLNNLPTNVAARVMEAMTEREARELIGLEGGSTVTLGKSNNSSNGSKED